MLRRQNGPLNRSTVPTFTLSLIQVVVRAFKLRCRIRIRCLRQRYAKGTGDVNRIALTGEDHHLANQLLASFNNCSRLFDRGVRHNDGELLATGTVD